LEEKTRLEMQEKAALYSESLAALKQLTGSYSRQVEELKETLNAETERFKAEQMARSEVESRLQTQERVRVQLEQKCTAYYQKLINAEKLIKLPTTVAQKNPNTVDIKEPPLKDNRAKATKKTLLRGIKILGIPAKKACECCGKQGLSSNKMSKIESGQHLCRECHKAFEAKLQSLDSVTS
jgi:hypothetical protein